MTNFKSIENVVFSKESKKKQLAASCWVEGIEVFSTNQIWKKMADKISDATSNVSICGYKFHGKSESGKLILQALQKLREKSKNSDTKIQVCLLINKRGKLAERIYKKNYDDGLEDFIKENENYPNFKFEVKYHEAQALNSYHAKQLIVDANTDHGSIMLAGGDIQSENDNPNKQYETGVLLNGSAIADLAMQDFQEAFNPNNATSNQKKVSTKTLSENSSDLSENSSDKFPVMYLSSKAKSLPLENKQHAPYKTAIIESIKRAKKSINILTANLNDPDIIRELADAANRNVKIKITMTKHKNDYVERFFGGTNEYSIKKIESLIKYQNKKNLRVHWSVNPQTKKLVHSNESYKMHGKFCMVDNEILLMGSSPLDRQAMVCSREIDVCLHIDQDKGKEILDKLFYNPYSFGRDYYVDKVIQKLSGEISRLNKKNTILSREKSKLLESLVIKLSKVGVTPHNAYEMLNKNDFNIKRTMQKKENIWDWRATKSERSLDACHEILKACVDELSNVKSDDDIQENIKMKCIRDKYPSNDQTSPPMMQF